LGRIEGRLAPAAFRPPCDLASAHALEHVIRRLEAEAAKGVADRL
jgi:hypothetical protein